jgi:hypothetical protein
MRGFLAFRGLKVIRRVFIGCSAIVAAASMLALPGRIATAGQNQATFYCDGVSMSKVDSKVFKETQKIWQRGYDKFRKERISGKQKVIIIGNGKDIWQITEWNKQGYHAIQPPENLEKQRIAGRFVGGELAGFLKMGAKPMGKRKIDGVNCDTYQRHDAVGTSYTMWVLPGPDKLTRRVRTQGKVNSALTEGEQAKAHTLLTIVDYKNWKKGVPAPDSLFLPPPGIKIQEAPQNAKP